MPSLSAVQVLYSLAAVQQAVLTLPQHSLLAGSQEDGDLLLALQEVFVQMG
jgi:hypothetical protein